MQEKALQEDGFFNGIPDEDKVPQLHAITSRKMAVLQCPDLMRYCDVEKDVLNNMFNQEQDPASQVSDSYLANLSQELFQSGQKAHAILKLILKGDEMATSFLLFNLISKVYQRSPEGLALGHLNINLTSVTPEQAKYIKMFLSKVLPVQMNLNLTIESLSEMRFQPRKNYDTN